MRRALIVAVLLAVAGTAGGVTAWQKTPPAAHLGRRVQERLAGTGGRFVPLAAVAPILARAVVATEDERFYRHHGIDAVGLARAIPYDLAHASFAQGASTITEQVAKLLYLHGNDHTPWLKLEDMALAVKLENRYSKSQILAAYLSSAYFGAGAYGIAAASRRYFGIQPARLTLGQASLLAGLPQAPSDDDPLVHPAAARARQVEVLRSLVRVGAVTAARAEHVLLRPLRLRGGTELSPVPPPDLAPGSPLAWPDAVAGLALVLLGVAAFGVGRRTGGGRAPQAAGVVALLLVLVGVVAMLRSIRTL